jgi:hypothetical protein
MGVLKFRLGASDLKAGPPALAKAYMTGQDRTPVRVQADLRGDRLSIARPGPESGRVTLPWPVLGHGRPMLTTANLNERPEPFHLAVELARGRLNDVRNQMADWELMGLRVPDPLHQAIQQAQRAFVHAATAGGDAEAASAQAGSSLEAAFRAGDLLVEAYTAQVLQRRLEHSPKLPTLLGCALDGEPKTAPWSAPLLECVNSARVRCDWARLAPDEGHYRWDEADAQVHWCRKKRLTPTAGPLLEFRPGALPDWLWLWDGDFDEIMAQAADLVRHAVTRYRGKVGAWHIAHRVASGEILGLSEEEQIRLTAKLLQVARQADPSAHLVVDFDRPWAEWMASSPFQLGPLHLADSLARADLGLAGIGLEVAPGYAGLGSHLRDLFEFSRLLDLYALINLPLHVSIVLPSSSGPDAKADAAGQVDPDQWPGPVDEETQRAWAARWVSLAAAKPFVRSVTWLQASDAAPHLFAHGGLFRPDQSAKPVVDWLRTFRAAHLA